MQDFIFTGILPLSAFVALKKKGEKGKQINSIVSANLTLGFYFEFNTTFLTTTILSDWAKWLGYYHVIKRTDRQKSLQSHKAYVYLVKKKVFGDWSQCPSWI